jgi:hypothetical protein
MVRHGKLVPDKHNILDHIQAFLIQSEIFMNELEQSSITGCAFIDDGQGMGIAQAPMFQPALMKKAITVMQDAYPFRPKKIHLLNMNPVMEKLVTLIKTFLNEKMKSRIMVHGKDWKQTVVDDLGADVLPEEYGGTNGKLQDHIGMQCC